MADPDGFGAGEWPRPGDSRWDGAVFGGAYDAIDELEHTLIHMRVACEEAWIRLEDGHEYGEVEEARVVGLLHDAFAELEAAAQIIHAPDCAWPPSEASSQPLPALSIVEQKPRALLQQVHTTIERMVGRVRALWTELDEGRRPTPTEQEDLAALLEFAVLALEGPEATLSSFALDWHPVVCGDCGEATDENGYCEDCEAVSAEVDAAKRSASRQRGDCPRCQLPIRRNGACSGCDFIQSELHQAHIRNLQYARRSLSASHNVRPQP